MRKILFLIVFAGISMSNICFAAPTLSVQTFQDKAGAGREVAAAITDMMTTELHKTGAFTLVERARLDAIGSEQKLGQSGLVDSATAPQVGKLIGAEYMVTGAITGYYYHTSGGIIPIPFVGGGGLVSNTGYVILDIRIVNNTTGQVIFTTRQEGASNQTIGGLITLYGGFGAGKTGGILAAATHKAVVKCVADVRGKFGGGGAASGGGEFHVLSVEGKKVTIDAGGSSGGGNKGQLYAVFSEGDVIKGINGEILGVNKKYKAVLKATEVYPNYSICEIVKGGTGVRRGDFLEPVDSADSVKI